MTTPDAEISPAHAYAAGPHVVLLDVRERDEWTAGHAPGTVHMPLGELDPAALPADRPVIAICRSGARSGRATTVLAAAGLQVRNMTGGMNAWQADGLPVVRDDGMPGRVR